MPAAETLVGSTKVLQARPSLYMSEAEMFGSLNQVVQKPAISILTSS